MHIIRRGRTLMSMRGFTLIELMLVVAIISIITAALVPQFSTSLQRAKDVKLKSDLSTLDSALMMYYVDKGTYPADLDSLITDSYIANSELKDALGNPFSYKPDTNSYKLTGQNSAGKEVASLASK